MSRALTIFSRYSRLGASSRLRSLQYIAALEAADFQIDLSPFFDDDYVRGLYAGQRRPIRTLYYYASRLRQCYTARKADLIWIEKEALPWLPWALEEKILPAGVPYVVDYDDAVFHRYDMDTKGVAWHFLHDKIDRVMENAACVTVGNSYLGTRAEAAGASRIEMVPTVVDLQKYGVAVEDHRTECLRIGWIGTPKTWIGSAQPVYESLAGTIQSAGATFRAIGASMEPYSKCGFENVPWSEGAEVALIQSLDVGIMPLQDDPWTRGKCGYKLIQYMACGLPVIASPIGVNIEIVQHGVNGFLAKTEAEWCYFVAKLLSEPELRKTMGAAGRRLVEQRYSLDAWAPKIVDILGSIK